MAITSDGTTLYVAAFGTAAVGVFDTAQLEANTFTPKSYEEFKEMIAAGGGFLQGAWCGDPDCEAQIKADTKATIRFLPLQPEQPGEPCIHCGKPGAERATWALAY